MLRVPSFKRPRLRMLKGDFVTLSNFAENVLDRNFHVVENERRRGRSVEAELWFFSATHNSHLAFNDEGRELFSRLPSRRW
jgi:hypothetical protein